MSKNSTFKSPKLTAMKYEIASQLGMGNYDNIDKGNLTSRQNGYVGGNITKTLVAQALGQSAAITSGGGTTGTTSTGTSVTTTSTTTKTGSKGSGSSISGFPGLSE